MRTLFTDIETAPATAHVWGLFNVNISLSQLLVPGRVICWSAKWRGVKKVEFRSEFHDGKEAMLNGIHSLLDEADAVVHYNGTTFDIPHLNREFLVAGMSPPAPYKQIDLLRTVRSQFRFQSRKLQHVSTELGFPGKVSHSGHQLWVDCLNGDPKAWKKMASYNRQDTVLLEDLYERLLPWIIRHPNVALFSGDVSSLSCTRCGSTNHQKRGVQVATTGRYQRYQCSDCGGWFRSVAREAGVKVTGT